MTIQANFPNVLPSLLLDFANAKKLDPRVTFTRATTAVYYDADTTAMAEQNLVTYSQQFNAWINGNVTLTGSQTAPDGTSTAWLMTDLGNNDDHRIYAFPSASTNTYSIGSAYFKNGTRRYAMLRLQDSSIIAGAVFDLQTGTVASTGGPNYYSSSITSVGGGWYRCVVIGTGFTNGVGNFVLAMSDTATYSANIIYAGSGATLYAWGAQVETRPTPNATAYTPTTTQVITTYIPVLMTAGGGQPRFDHNPTTRESLGLLIEEQRTNSVVYSATLDNWGSINAQSGGRTIVPDGTLSGVNANRTGPNNLYSIVSASASTTYTFSVYAKAGFGSIVNFGVESGFGVYAVVGFNLSSGIAPSPPSGTTVSMTAVGNGWYRLTMTGTTTGAATTVILHISATTADFTNGVWVWGAQLEVGAFATSYIPTVAAAATRSADAPSITGANFTSFYNQQEGTVYVEYANANVDGGTRLLEMWQGAPFSISFELVADGSVWSARTYNYGAYQVGLTLGATTASAKLIYAVKNNDFAASDDGAAPQTTASGLLGEANQLNIGYTERSGTATQLNGCIKKLAYYPVRVTNANLQALTS
jgi:hypothetical protein